MTGKFILIRPFVLYGVQTEYCGETELCNICHAVLHFSVERNINKYYITNILKT
jgi:hypothetical protein